MGNFKDDIMHRSVVGIYRLIYGRKTNMPLMSNISIAKMYLRWLIKETHENQPKSEKELQDDLRYLDQQIRIFTKRHES